MSQSVVISDAEVVTQQADLVLEGGGVKGIGLLGAVVELAERGWTFPRIAGTSAGAIVASLVAAYTEAGRDVSDLITVMEELDYRRFRDGTLLDHFGLPGRAIDLAFHDGVYKGQFLVDWLSAELDKIGIRTFGDLRIDDDPGSALAPNQRYRLVVMASDISRGELVRLPWDYSYYGLDPDKQLIVDAVRASMSIPFFFRPVTLHAGPGGGGDVTLVDGGMLSNFPVDAFDRADELPARWPTFGVKLSARPDARQISHPIDGPFNLAIASLKTLLDGHDTYHLNDERVTDRTIFVDTMRISSTDFSIEKATQQQLFHNGRTAASAFLSHWPPASTGREPALSA